MHQLGGFGGNYLCSCVLGIHASDIIIIAHCWMRLLVAGPQLAQSHHKSGIGLAQSVSI